MARIWDWWDMIEDLDDPSFWTWSELQHKMADLESEQVASQYFEYIELE